MVSLLVSQNNVPVQLVWVIRNVSTVNEDALFFYRDIGVALRKEHTDNRFCLGVYPREISYQTSCFEEQVRPSPPGCNNKHLTEIVTQAREVICKVALEQGV